jgi:hypothetical protein
MLNNFSTCKSTNCIGGIKQKSRSIYDIITINKIIISPLKIEYKIIKRATKKKRMSGAHPHNGQNTNFKRKSTKDHPN